MIQKIIHELSNSGHQYAIFNTYSENNICLL